MYPVFCLHQFGINYDKYYKQTTLILTSVGYNGLHYWTSAEAFSCKLHL